MNGFVWPDILLLHGFVFLLGFVTWIGLFLVWIDILLLHGFVFLLGLGAWILHMDVGGRRLLLFG